MQKKNTKKLIVALMIACVTILGVEFAQAQAPEDDVFGVVHVKNLDALLPKIGAFIDQFQPGMGGMVNTMMVGNMLFHNPNWAGMNAAGDFTAVILNPMKFPGNPVAILAPVTNKDEYLKALGQTLTKGKETNGVLAFTTPEQKGLFISVVGDQAIMTESAEVAALAKSLVDGKSALLSDAHVVKGQISASLSMAKLMTAMQPMIDMFKQQMLMSLEQGTNAQGEAQTDQQKAEAQAVKGIVEAEVDVFLSLAAQVDKVQWGVGFEDNGLRLAKSVLALPNTNLAKFMAAQKPKTSDLMGVIPADSAILMSGSIMMTPEFKNGYVEFMKAITTAAQTAQAADAKTIETVATWAQAILNAFGGDFAAGALSPTSETMLTEVISVVDPAKAKELVKQYPEMMKAMSGLYEQAGLKMNMALAATDTVKSGEILNYTFNATADAIADPKEQEVFKTLFGEELSLPIGFTKGYAVMGFGKNAKSQVETVMNAVDSGAKGEVKQTPGMFGLSEEHNLFMYISVPKIMAWAVKNIPDVPAVDMAEGPGIAAGARFVDGHMEGELFLPTEELLLLKKLGEQMEAAKSAAGTEEPAAEESEDESGDDSADDSEEDSSTTK
ncbi:hypothetical protein U14_03671 [Candidatus Moduliflexus flocculans]|uniref:Uncharacterized protein n=1 Tax=Candidatus Moduliflexus flocculans TaxID=1499966 RepID=A0A081BPV4_9BACT|nr:hypothetical protein U14_03671 [Candidatus Moduliflexus flocculans]